jgi:homoserine trans-succinylase
MEFINSTEFLGVDYNKADCTVRALAVCMGSSYDEAEEFLKDVFNRDKGRGVRLVSFLNYFSQNSSKTIHKCTNLKKSDLTFSRFKKELMDKTKTYMIVSKRHCFAVKNGIIYGNHSDAKASRRKLHGVFEI